MIRKERKMMIWIAERKVKSRRRRGS